MCYNIAICNTAAHRRYKIHTCTVGLRKVQCQLSSSSRMFPVSPTIAHQGEEGEWHYSSCPVRVISDRPRVQRSSAHKRRNDSIDH